MNGTNVCEHGDHPAPEGRRFCSPTCMECEITECDHTQQDCAGICGFGDSPNPRTERKGDDAPYGPCGSVNERSGESCERLAGHDGMHEVTKGRSAHAWDVQR